MLWKSILSLTLAGMLSAPGGMLPQPPEEPTEIYMLLRSMSEPENILLKNGAEEKADELGVNVSILGPNQGTEGQIQVDMLENIVRGGRADAVIIDPIDAASVKAMLDELDPDIPVLSLNHNIGYEKQVTFLGNSHEDSIAQNVGAHAAKLAGKDAKTVILRGTADDDLERGFRQAFPGDAVVDARVCNDTADAAEAAMRELLQQYPSIHAVCATTDTRAIGAARVVGRDIPIVGIGFSSEAMQMVKDGRLSGLMLSSYHDIGALSVELAVRTIHGDTIERLISPSITLITSETADHILNDPHYNLVS